MSHIPFHGRGPQLTKDRSITNQSIPTRRLETTIIKQNPAPFQTTGSKNLRSGQTPRAQEATPERKQNVRDGYTTIFLPGNQGVTIHKDGTLTITTSKPPVLQGCKMHGAKLWTVSAQNTNQTYKQALNAYSLPSIGQKIKYLHAAAVNPPEEMWTKD